MVESESSLLFSVVIVGDEIPQTLGVQQLHGSDAPVAGDALFVDVIELGILGVDRHIQQRLSQIAGESVVTYGKIDQMGIGSVRIETCRFDPKIFGKSLEQ